MFLSKTDEITIFLREGKREAVSRRYQDDRTTAERHASSVLPLHADPERPIGRDRLNYCLNRSQGENQAGNHQWLFC